MTERCLNIQNPSHLEQTLSDTDKRMLVLATPLVRRAASIHRLREMIQGVFEHVYSKDEVSFLSPRNSQRENSWLSGSLDRIQLDMTGTTCTRELVALILIKSGYSVIQKSSSSEEAAIIIR